MSSSKTVKHILIIGGGISGLASALGISCSIYEVRAAPSTLGGAVNLTLAALRCLDHIGVLKHLQGKGGHYTSRRGILRAAWYSVRRAQF